MDRSAQGAPESTAAALPLAVRRHAVVTELARSLVGPCRIPHGATVVAAVSGGSDSTALLLALTVLRHRSEGYRPVIVHINHTLRPDAGDDERFVADLAARFELPFRSAAINPGVERGNTLAHARRLRYEALADIAQQAGAAAVVTAHHADDQFETMLMALSRGTGIEGLRGMRRRRQLRPGLPLVRPLLTLRKETLTELCNAANVTWREDPSNRDLSKSRARLRQEVLPVLESLWPGAASRAAATSESLALAVRLVRRAVRKKFGPTGVTSWRRRDLASLSPALLSAGLRNAVREQIRRESGSHHDMARGTPRRTWLQAANAVLDGGMHERRFTLDANWELRIDATTVELLPTPSPSGRTTNPVD